MKNLLLLLLLAPAICSAQKNLCKKIKREVDRKRGTTVYKSPQLKHLSVIREFKATEFFGLYLCLDYHHEMVNVTGATIEFSDGSKYLQKDAVVHCQQQPRMIATGYTGPQPNPYLLEGFFRFDSLNLGLFRSRRIAAIYLSDASALISENEGEKIKAFINCMVDVKPK